MSYTNIAQKLITLLKLTNNVITEQELNLARFLDKKMANGYLVTRIIFFILRLLIVAAIFRLVIWVFYIIFAIYLFQTTFQQNINKSEN